MAAKHIPAMMPAIANLLTQRAWRTAPDHLLESVVHCDNADGDHAADQIQCRPNLGCGQVAHGFAGVLSFFRWHAARG